MEQNDFTYLGKKLESVEQALAEQRLMLGELLRIAKITQLSSAFSVDAANGLFTALDRVLTSSR